MSLASCRGRGKRNLHYWRMYSMGCGICIRDLSVLWISVFVGYEPHLHNMRYAMNAIVLQLSLRLCAILCNPQQIPSSECETGMWL